MNSRGQWVCERQTDQCLIASHSVNSTHPVIQWAPLFNTHQHSQTLRPAEYLSLPTACDECHSKHCVRMTIKRYPTALISYFVKAYWHEIDLVNPYFISGGILRGAFPCPCQHPQSRLNHRQPPEASQIHPPPLDSITAEKESKIAWLKTSIIFVALCCLELGAAEKQCYQYNQKS